MINLKQKFIELKTEYMMDNLPDWKTSTIILALLVAASALIACLIPTVKFMTESPLIALMALGFSLWHLRTTTAIGCTLYVRIFRR